MAPTYRTATQTRRGNRNIVPEHDDFEGLPVRQWRQELINIAPPPPMETIKRPDHWSVELPFGMPKDWHLLPPHSQDLLRHARSGRLYKRPHPPEEEEGEGYPEGNKGDKKETETGKPPSDGVMVKVWKLVPRQSEGSGLSHLAKRHKNTITLPTKASIALSIPETTVTRATVRRVDAAGNAYEQTVILQEGEMITDGEIISTTEVSMPVSAEAVAAATAAQAAAQNGDAAGAAQMTSNRRRPPPRKRKKGPGRGRKKSKLPLPATSAPVSGDAAASSATGEDGVGASTAAGQPVVMMEVDDSTNPDTKMTDASYASSDEEEGDDGKEGDEGLEEGEPKQESHSEDGDHKAVVKREEPEKPGQEPGGGYVASATARLDHDMDSSDLSSPPSTREDHSPPSHEASARASRASSQPAPANPPAQLAHLTEARPMGSPLRQVMTQTTPANSKPASPTGDVAVAEEPTAAGQAVANVVTTQIVTETTETTETIDSMHVVVPLLPETTTTTTTETLIAPTEAVEPETSPAQESVAISASPAVAPEAKPEPEPEPEPQSAITDKDDNDDFDLLGGLERELDRQAGENNDQTTDTKN